MQSVGINGPEISFQPLLSRHSIMMASSSSSATPAEEKIIMLSGYPFYVNGPDPKALQEIAAKTKTVLQEICGDQLKSVDRMGSSAIDGIAGTPVCDVIAQLSPWPMTELEKKQMAQAGFEFKGNAPHDPKDEWFFGGALEPGHLGRVVLHTIPEGSEFVQDMKAFVDYVNKHPDAFQRYNNVKVEGAVLMSKSSEEDGRLIGYKQKKAAVCKEIIQEAKEWWKTTNGGVDTEQ